MHASVQQLPSSHVQYDSLSISSPKLLEDAVKTLYPPTISCVVKYRAELRRTGRRTWVGLHISGMDPEMDFQCPAYEQVQGGCTPPTLGPAETETTSQSITSVCPSGMQDLGGSYEVRAWVHMCIFAFPILEYNQDIVCWGIVYFVYILYVIYMCRWADVICIPSMIEFLNYKYAA